jgi:ACS family sodium-dependent inorganic phosphate cotransporter
MRPSSSFSCLHLCVPPLPSSAFLPAGLVALSLGLASFSLAGLYCNHADLSKRYSSILLGLTNTTGALPGIVGVAITGGWVGGCEWVGGWVAVGG